jgi:hypothetical protein
MAAVTPTPPTRAQEAARLAWEPRAAMAAATQAMAGKAQASPRSRTSGA